MSEQPRVTVSVVMSVYNGDRYLREAVDSILNQTFTDFEFIIIDDGSTDTTWQILTAYAKQDSRILPIRNDENIGLTCSLNKGIALAKGKYIARMDADDISLRDRFAKQVAFMDAHPEVGVCGSWIKFISEGISYIWHYPTDDKTIRCWLLFKTALAHPSIIMRKNLFLKAGLSYDPAYKYAQDHELWVRSSKYCKLANIGEVLLLYRIHNNQVWQRHRTDQIALARRIQLAQVKSLGIQPTADELNLHYALSMSNFEGTKDFVNQAHTWLSKIKAENEKTGSYDELALAKFLGQLWFSLGNAATKLEWWMWETFWQSPLSASADLTWQQKLKFALKCKLRYKPYLWGRIWEQLEKKLSCCSRSR